MLVLCFQGKVISLLSGGLVLGISPGGRRDDHYLPGNKLVWVSILKHFGRKFLLRLHENRSEGPREYFNVSLLLADTLLFAMVERTELLKFILSHTNFRVIDST